jgi:hypothetical protein
LGGMRIKKTILISIDGLKNKGGGIIDDFITGRWTIVL